MKKIASCFLGFFLVSNLFLLAAFAQLSQLNDVPRIISYQATLTDGTGTPIKDDDYRITIRLYPDKDGSPCLWHDTYRVHSTRGIVNINIGGGSIPLPDVSQMSGSLWLGVQINDEEEIKNYSELTAAPYALNVPNGSITAQKIGADYVGSISINGQKISRKGEDLNIITGNGISASVDPGTHSLLLGTETQSTASTKGAEAEANSTITGDLTVVQNAFLNTGRTSPGNALTVTTIGSNSAANPGVIKIQQGIASGGHQISVKTTTESMGSDATITLPNITGVATVQGNTFNGANQLLQLDGSGNLPASISSSFISNSNTPQASASFNVDGTGAVGSTMSVGANLLFDPAVSHTIKISAATSGSSYPLTIEGQAGSSDDLGGVVFINGGHGTNGTSSLSARDGGNVITNGGVGGAGSSANQGGNGGSSFLQGGFGGSGFGGLFSGGTGGDAEVLGGEGGGANGSFVGRPGGRVLVQAGQGGDGSPLAASGAAGSVQILGGQAGFDGGAGSGSGGNVEITGGNGVTGGAIIINGGVGLSGPFGDVNIQTSNGNITMGNAIGSLKVTSTHFSITSAGDVTANSFTGDGSHLTNVSAWGLTGNNVTNPSDFIGTTGNQPFEIHVNQTGAPFTGTHRVMRYEPNATSANIIGGFQTNHVSLGVIGATIAGGAEGTNPHSITGSYGTIGGGDGNTAAGFATVAGGEVNTASGGQSTVAGGQSNIAHGQWSSVGGGISNNATSDYSTISGGSSNTARGFGAVVSGGSGNSVGGDNSNVGGGNSNSANGTSSTVIGGSGLDIEGSRSFGFLANQSSQNMRVIASNTAILGNVDLWLANNDGNSHELRFYGAHGNSGLDYPFSDSYFIGLKAPASLTASTSFTLPTSDGTAAQLLATDGSGNLEWSDIELSGAPGEVTYFDGAHTATGDANFTWDAGSQALQIDGGVTVTNGATISGFTRINGMSEFFSTKIGNAFSGGIVELESANPDVGIKINQSGAGSTNIGNLHGAVAIVGINGISGDGIMINASNGLCGNTHIGNQFADGSSTTIEVDPVHGALTINGLNGISTPGYFYVNDGSTNIVGTASISDVATALIPSGTFIDNSTSTQLNASFNIDGDGTIGGTLNVAENITSGPITCPFVTTTGDALVSPAIFFGNLVTHFGALYSPSLSSNPNWALPDASGVISLGGITNGTLDNATLRWDNTSEAWLENTHVQEDASGVLSTDGAIHASDNITSAGAIVAPILSATGDGVHIAGTVMFDDLAGNHGYLTPDFNGFSTLPFWQLPDAAGTISLGGIINGTTDGSTLVWDNTNMKWAETLNLKFDNNSGNAAFAGSLAIGGSLHVDGAITAGPVTAEFLETTGDALLTPSVVFGNVAIHAGSLLSPDISNNPEWELPSTSGTLSLGGIINGTMDGSMLAWDNTNQVWAENLNVTADGIGNVSIANTLKVGGSIVATTSSSTASSDAGVTVSDVPVFIITNGGASTTADFALTLPSAPASGDMIVVINHDPTWNATYTGSWGTTYIFPHSTRTFYYDGSRWQ